MKYFLMSIIAILLLISPVSGAEVIFDGSQILVTGVPEDVSLGVVDIVMSYPDTLNVTGVTIASPFMGAKNINEETHEILIAAIQSGRGLSGNVTVAYLNTEGIGDTIIYVRDLGDRIGQPIPCSNAGYEPVDEPSVFDSPLSSDSGGDGADSSDEAIIKEILEVSENYTASLENDSVSKEVMPVEVEDPVPVSERINSSKTNQNITENTLSAVSEVDDVSGQQSHVQENAQQTEGVSTPLSGVTVLMAIVGPMVCAWFGKEYHRK